MGIEAAILATAVAGAGISFYGAQQQSAAMRRSAQTARRTGIANQNMRNRNAMLFEQEAAHRERIGGRQVRDFRKKFSPFQARTSTRRRKSGVQAQTGTPLQILAYNADQAAEETSAIDLLARTEGGRLRQRATGERLAGEFALLEGQTVAAATDIKAQAVQTASYANLAAGLGKIGFDAQTAGLIS